MTIKFSEHMNNLVPMVVEQSNKATAKTAPKVTKTKKVSKK